MYASLYLICAAVSCLYVLVWSYSRRARKHLSSLPSYFKFPILGNIPQFFGDGHCLLRRLLEMSETCERMMSPFVIWFGPFPLVMFSDPEDIKAVTNTFIEKPHYYDFGRVWLGDGLVTAPGNIWKRSIKNLAGTFTTNIVDGYQNVFNTQAQKLVDKLKKEVGREPIFLMSHLSFTTLEAICQTALGVARISESITPEKYYEAFNTALRLLIARGVNVLLHPQFIYRLTPAYRQMKKSVAVLHSVSETVITRRKKEREVLKKNGSLKPDVTDTGKIKFKAFLDILLELREIDPNLTDKQIKDDVDTIIVGGQETVASTLFYTLQMIGRKPDAQNKLYKELYEIFGDSKRPIEKEDLNKMKYCEACINETLRIFPPLPVVLRYADKDLQLKSCTIPKGTTVGVNAWGAGRSPREWGPDAGEYNPDRWFNDCPAQSAAFIPFSYGKRACIGKRYAIVILKTILAYCIRELEFVSSSEEFKLKVDVTLRPVSGHLMQVKLRK